MIRSGNPALTAGAFAAPAYGEQGMTVQGTVNKTALALALVLMGALYVWNRFFEGLPVGAYMAVGGIGGFILALVTIFKKTAAPWSTPVYAVLKGLMLGGLSAMMEQRYPGIVLQAVLATFMTLLALLAAYTSGLIRMTDNFRLGLVAATGGIVLVYLASFILGFFGVRIPLIHESGPVGIGFSLVVVVIAALNLVMDFDFIEHGAERGAPKYMEWYGAFGLLVTLIWLYIEILHLLAKLQSRRR